MPVVTTTSGLQYEDVVEGSGEVVVEVNGASVASGAAAAGILHSA